MGKMPTINLFLWPIPQAKKSSPITASPKTIQIVAKMLMTPKESFWPTSCVNRRKSCWGKDLYCFFIDFMKAFHMTPHERTRGTTWIYVSNFLNLWEGYMFFAYVWWIYKVSKRRKICNQNVFLIHRWCGAFCKYFRRYKNLWQTLKEFCMHTILF